MKTKSHRVNRHQIKFFRKLRSNPDGLPLEQWPPGPTMARWMNQPAFSDRMQSMMAVRKLETEFNAEAAQAKALRLFLDGAGDPIALAKLVVKMSRELRRKAR